MRITHTMNALAGGKSRGKTGDGKVALKRIDKGQNGGLEMHWQAYRLLGLKFNNRSYGRNPLSYHW